MNGETSECRSSVCARCRRKLKDPRSVKRGMGPVCWVASGGGVFEHHLDATDEEWAEREAFLRRGGEIDLGSNWERMQSGNMLPQRMRVSIRYRDGAYEAYGSVTDGSEIMFERGQDLRAVYAAAVQAGPASSAQAHWMRRQRMRSSLGVA